MAQKTEVSGMNYNWLKRVGTISSWVVVVSLIYLLAAPLLLFLLLKVHDGSGAVGEFTAILPAPGFALYESLEFYETYCKWVVLR